MTDKVSEISKEVLDDQIGRVIDQTAWQRANNDYKEKNSEFFDFYVDGHPRLLSNASNEIMSFLWMIQNHKHWAMFRSSIQVMVDKTDGIKTAICLALGKYQRLVEGVEGIWAAQYAVFAYICQVIDEKQKDDCEKQGRAFSRIKRYFQDPDFDIRTEYILSKIERNIDLGENMVVEHPEATNLINGETFLYALHITPPMWQYIFRRNELGDFRLPQLMATNTISEINAGRDRAICDRYHKDVSLGRSAVPSQILFEFEAGFDDLVETHKETRFPDVSDPKLHYGAFQNISFYQQTMLE